MIDQISKQISRSIETKEKLLQDSEILEAVAELVSCCLDALKSGGKIIFCGNGGSFADAQHLSAEFTARFLFDRAPLASIALGTNSSTISAISNDYGYEHVFSRELESIGKANDVFIGISTSGNSPNVLAAMEIANKLEMNAVSLTGSTGGKLAAMGRCIRIPSDDTARIQECHILLGHIVCELVEHKYFRE